MKPTNYVAPDAKIGKNVKFWKNGWWLIAIPAYCIE